MDPAITARCYVRVSTEEQAQSGYSLAAQRDKLALFCQLQGYELCAWYRDDGVSAKDLNRLEFQRMMQEARSGDVIVVYKLDRLTRSVRDLDDLLRAFEQRGLHFRSVTEQFDTTTATGRLMIRMVGEFAQWERETIAERTSFGKQKKRASGEWNGGRPPFGYMAVPSGRVKAGRQLLQLVPDPHAAHLVRQIYERYLSGYGIRQIATWLNAELGARTPQGRPFTAEQVSRILRNPAYVGDLAHGRRGGRRERVASTHEPLVARELFDRVQAMLEQRRQMPARQATGSYVLSGIGRCGVCGGPLTVSRLAGKQAGQYVYRCRNWAAGRGCGGSALALKCFSGRLAEAQLVQVLERCGSPVALAEFWRWMEAEYKREGGMAEQEAERLRRDLAGAQSAVRRWSQLYEAGHVEMAEFIAGAAPHRERMKTLRAQLEAMARKPSPPPAPVFSIVEVWAGAEPEERKMLLRHFTAAWGVTIHLYPGRRLALTAGPFAPASAAPESGG